LRTFVDSILTIDQNLVTDAVRTLSLNTISAFQRGVQLEWNDAELAIYLVFIFGEINKSTWNLLFDRSNIHPLLL
jgi:exportin-T